PLAYPLFRSFVTAPAPTQVSTLSLHDALPIFKEVGCPVGGGLPAAHVSSPRASIPPLPGVLRRRSPSAARLIAALRSRWWEAPQALQLHWRSRSARSCLSSPHAEHVLLLG